MSSVPTIHVGNGDPAFVLRLGANPTHTHRVATCDWLIKMQDPRISAPLPFRVMCGLISKQSVTGLCRPESQHSHCHAAALPETIDPIQARICHFWLQELTAAAQ